MNQDEMRFHLEEILAQARLVTLLQPVLDLDEAQVAGYEALSRGPSSSPLYAPQAMSRIAEHHGLLPALDWVRVRMALRAFAQLRLAGRLFVNVSPSSVLDPRFSPAPILEALTDAGLSRNQLILEITEDSAALDYADLRHAATQLRAAGIEVAIDDLGEGFASLRLWSELKPALVKIDKHFIAGMDQDPHKIQFVRSMRQFAEGLQSCVIAEGVESISELAVLKDLGIRYAQGYLIGRPSPVPNRLPPRDVKSCLKSSRWAYSPWRMRAAPYRFRSRTSAFPPHQ